MYRVASQGTYRQAGSVRQGQERQRAGLEPDGLTASSNGRCPSTCMGEKEPRQTNRPSRVCFILSASTRFAKEMYKHQLKGEQLMRLAGLTTYQRSPHL